MDKKKLGRGLDALIPKIITEKISGGIARGVTEIDISSIKPNPFQPRKDFNKEKLAELVQSIKERGVIEPIVLRRAPNETGYYEIIVGERRFRASKEAGLKKIPAVVKETNDIEMLEIALIENLQRENLNPLEEAEGYKMLLDKFSYTQEWLARRIGKDRATVANTLRLLNLPHEIKDYILRGTLTEGHGRAILSLDNEMQQIAVARKIVKNGLSVRASEKLAGKLKTKGKTAAKKEKDINIMDLEEELMDILGTKVNIMHRGKKGKIEIQYHSEDDFQRILEKLRKL